MKHLSIIVFLLFLFSCGQENIKKNEEEPIFYKTSKPYTRWWWFASKIKKEDIRANLEWLKENNFGGVEIAWVYPLNRRRKSEKHLEDTTYIPRYAWLSKEWTDIVVYAKKCADSLGLGCDFTFGTGWPFGDTYTPRRYASKVYNPKDEEHCKTLSVSWEYPKTGYIIDHLSSKAFEDYANRMGKALLPAMKGSKSAIFCDSWEVETKYLWTSGFERRFKKVYGYDITNFMDSIYEDKFFDVRYDYMKLISELVIKNFYSNFTKKAHELGGFSRAQCSGSPTDILTAYGVIDVPESEAMLYEPNYSKIPASAACLAKKRVITAESFTCMYGWPDEFITKEQIADVKIVADALLANGVNHIIWHGMPMNPKGVDTIKFYASVHVGSKGNLAKDIPEFNKYLEKTCSYMKKGKTYSNVAIYIPQEDAWCAGFYPKELQLPWAWGQYEMRYIKPPDILKGFHPLWINNHFIKQGKVVNNKLVVGDAEFSALYVDVNFIDYEALQSLLTLAKQDFPICLVKTPRNPSHVKYENYDEIINQLKKNKNVYSNFNDLVRATKIKPLVEGDYIPDYWCRNSNDTLYIFFANPKANNLKLPITYGQSFSEKTETFDIKINHKEKTFTHQLVFKPYQSILLEVSKGGVRQIDITYNPPVPVVKTDYVPKPF